MSDWDEAPLNTVFLLSPARTGSPRAEQLASGQSKTEVCKQLCSPQGAPIGDVFAFLSSLYFRGKLSYARVFSRPPRDMPGVLVIAPGRGLLPASQPITPSELRAFATVDVDHDNEQFVGPLVRDAGQLAEHTREDTAFVLLGSVASAKYVNPLLQVFGERLLFPSEFVGRGDMSRGGLLLRAAEAGVELEYQPVVGATLHGARTPRLPKKTRGI